MSVEIHIPRGEEARPSIEVSGRAETEWSDEQVAQWIVEGFNSNLGQMADLPPLGQDVAIDVKQSIGRVEEAIPWYDMEFTREGVKGLRFLRYFFEDKVLHRQVEGYKGRRGTRLSVVLYPHRVEQDHFPRDFGVELSVDDVAKITGIYLRLWMARDEYPEFEIEDIESRLALKDNPDEPLSANKIFELIMREDFDVEEQLLVKTINVRRKLWSYSIRGGSDELWGVAVDWYLLERYQEEDI